MQFQRSDYNNYCSNLNLGRPQFLLKERRMLTRRSKISDCGGRGGNTVSQFVWAFKKAVMLKKEI